MKKFDVPLGYRSELLHSLKNYRKSLDKMKKDYSPTKISFGEITFFLPRFFGFCYGVENAIEIAYRTLKENPSKKIYLLGEMIHNPSVNEELKNYGIKSLIDTRGNQLISFDEVNKNDIVLVPAFGTTTDIMEVLKKKEVSIEQYNTTCPFVEKVWKKAEKIGNKGFTIIVHGKHYHEETRATFSRTQSYNHSLIILDMKEAELLAEYIAGKKNKEEFYKDFEGKYSDGFDPEKHLKKIGLVNQTTMLASQTKAIAEYLKTKIAEHYQLDERSIKEYFAEYRDTLCYATNDNQNAILNTLDEQIDFAVVIGGFNSSNTTQLYTLCKSKYDTVFINSKANIFNDGKMKSFDIHAKKLTLSDYNIKDISYKNILISAGASCPDSEIEGVMKKIVELKDSKHEWEKQYHYYTKEAFAL